MASIQWSIEKIVIIQSQILIQKKIIKMMLVCSLTQNNWFEGCSEAENKKYLKFIKTVLTKVLRW